MALAGIIREIAEAISATVRREASAGTYASAGGVPIAAYAEAVAKVPLIAAAPDGLAVAQSAPILSKYHGQRGFEVERFIADYDAWRVTARAFISKATGAA